MVISFHFHTQKTPEPVTAPIVDSVLWAGTKTPLAVVIFFVGLLNNMQNYGVLRRCSIRPELMAEGRTMNLSNGRSTTSGQMVVKLRRDPHAPHIP